MIMNKKRFSEIKISACKQKNWRKIIFHRGVDGGTHQ